MSNIRVVREVVYIGDEARVNEVLALSVQPNITNDFQPMLSVTVTEKERTVLDGPPGI